MLIVRLTQNGNATAVNLPKRYLHGLNWKRGDFVIVEHKKPGELTVRQALEPDARPSTHRPAAAR